MKYGQHLRDNIAPEYGMKPYLDYGKLDSIIRNLSEMDTPAQIDQTQRLISLTIPPSTTSKGTSTINVSDYKTAKGKGVNSKKSQKGEEEEEDITEEHFLSCMDSEMNKVEQFTLSQVTKLRQKIIDLENKIDNNNNNDDDDVSVMSNKSKIIIEILKTEADNIANSFLILEKYVNINYMGFHKILKKHDKHCSYNPCKEFYTTRMAEQAWVRGDYSDIVVKLSYIYSKLRNYEKNLIDKDENVNAFSSSSSSQQQQQQQKQQQQYIKSTRKYWVKTEDVSRVKYFILRNLPVMLEKRLSDVGSSRHDISNSSPSDSHMVNSVYLDNDQMELYHSRLDTIPGAQALRLRWYGATDKPDYVHIERKTHHNIDGPSSSSKKHQHHGGDMIIGDVKDSFIVKENEVINIMNDNFPIEIQLPDEGEKKQLLGSGSGGGSNNMDQMEQLVSEVTQVISSKQLVPTIRTQYMRTNFQIPFDTSVHVSLDTNVCMISERTSTSASGQLDISNRGGGGGKMMGVTGETSSSSSSYTSSSWHRDQSVRLDDTEITKFPHAILEIKLQIPIVQTTNDDNVIKHPNNNNNKTPKWILDLQNSGLLYEVHKFSKFIHGCSVLLSEDIRSVPYWIDDISLRNSIISSGAERILVVPQPQVQQQQQQPPPPPPPPQPQQQLQTAATTTTNYGTTSSSKPPGGGGISGGNDMSSLVTKKMNNLGVVKEVDDEEEGGGGGRKGRHNFHFFHGEDIYDGDDDDDDDDDDICCWNGDEEKIGGSTPSSVGTNDTCTGWLFPFCSPGQQNDSIYYDMLFIPPTSESGGGGGRVLPKVFFANERTYLHWLHASVTIYTIALGILAFSSEGDNNGWAHWYALSLLPISLAFCLYALHVFLWRSDRIKAPTNNNNNGMSTTSSGYWDDPRGPLLLGTIVCLVLLINFFAKLYNIATYEPSPDF